MGGIPRNRTKYGRPKMEPSCDVHSFWELASQEGKGILIEESWEKIPRKIGSSSITASTLTKGEYFAVRKPEEWAARSVKSHKRRFIPKESVIPRKEMHLIPITFPKLSRFQNWQSWAAVWAVTGEHKKGIWCSNRTNPTSPDSFRGIAEAKARTQEIVIEWKDLDKFTSRDDICVGRIEECEKVDEEGTWYRGTQTTIISRISG